MNVNRDVGIVLDLFEDKKREWHFESDWSPKIQRHHFRRLEKLGLIEVENSDDPDDRVLRLTEAGEREALRIAA